LHSLADLYASESSTLAVLAHLAVDVSKDPLPLTSTSNLYGITLWLFNIAMENGPFIDGLPFLKNGWIFHGYVK
jgi:hypothetical protein